MKTMLPLTMLSLAVGVAGLGGHFHEQGWTGPAWALLTLTAIIALYALALWLRSAALEVLRSVALEVLKEGKEFLYDFGAAAMEHLETRQERKEEEGAAVERHERSLERAKEKRDSLKRMTEDLRKHREKKEREI